MRAGWLVLVLTVIAVVLLGVAFAVTGSEGLDRLSGAVGGLAGVAALGFSVWAWVQERSPRAPAAPAASGRARPPLRLGRTPALGTVLADRISLKAPRLATLWCVPLAVVAALDDGHARSLALGAVFALPYALVWWYAARRRLRPGHWAADAVAILILGGWSAMVVGASVDMSGPSHLWITPPALLVLAGLGWTATGAWLLRLLRDLRP